MAIFICDECGCLENTSLGCYWPRKLNLFTADKNGKALCSECAPAEYKDGSATSWGKWHDRFPKKKAKKEDYKRVINPPEEGK